MKSLLSVSLAMVALFGTVSCETTSTAETNSATGTTNSGGTEAAGSQANVPTVKPYPLNTCLVTGEGLESKGGSFTLVHQGQEVKLCCVACKMAFKSSPETYLAKLP